MSDAYGNRAKDFLKDEDNANSSFPRIPIHYRIFVLCLLYIGDQLAELVKLAKENA